MFSLVPWQVSQTEVKEPFPIPVSLGTETGLYIPELRACDELEFLVTEGHGHCQLEGLLPFHILHLQMGKSSPQKSRDLSKLK